MTAFSTAVAQVRFGRLLEVAPSTMALISGGVYSLPSIWTLTNSSADPVSG